MIDFNGEIAELDRNYIQRSFELALKAEKNGNMPIGSVIADGSRIIAEGMNQLLVPSYNPGAHAEIMALGNVPSEEWKNAERMTCYSSLEPCIMCTGSLLLHGIRRIVFGAIDEEGGGRFILKNLPPYYEKSAIQWIGPVDSKNCRPLYERAREQFKALPCGCP